MKKRILPPLMVALALSAAPSFAHADRVVIDTAPPPPTAEDIPAAREGYVWAPGYWGWSGTRHEWTRGHWEKARTGYRYVSPRWAQEDGRWTLYPEQWVKNEDDKEKTVSKDSSLPEIAKR